MRSLTAEQLTFLKRYGFDELLFEAWRKGVAQGWLAREKNVVHGSDAVDTARASGEPTISPVAQMPLAPDRR